MLRDLSCHIGVDWEVTFTGHQLETVWRVFKMAESGILISPTGSGKSMTYQLGSLLFPDKITLVLTPTVSLGQDQVAGLERMQV